MSKRVVSPPSKARATSKAKKPVKGTNLKARNLKRKKASPKPVTTLDHAPQELAVTEDTYNSTSQKATHIPIVGIGASAGGLEALEAFFKTMSSNSGAAFVVVVHLSPDFKSLMPELISKHTKMPVSAPTHDTTLLENHVYIIPPGKNMTLENGSIHLQDQDRSPGHSLNLPIDLFFSTLGVEAREQATAIILSGTGSDGSRGIRQIKEYGGMVFVQDPSTAKFGGMPTVAVETQLADVVASPDNLAKALLTYFQYAHIPVFDAPEPITSELHGHLLTSSGLDLSYYRPAVVERRVKRRMGLSGYTDVKTYINLLKEKPEEARQLTKDLLIGVTNFFRDSEVFEALKTDILPQLYLDKHTDDPVRVWVPACSTGEEVYSLAILLLEVKEALKHERSFIIFATDIDHESVAKASLGEYPLSLMADVSPQRLGKFFSQNGENFMVNQEVRKHIRFAQHNLVQDTPFSKIDLVSCRNFLIYVQPTKQERVINALHFALRPQGVMLLGPAETVVGFDESFELLKSGHKLYKKVGPVSNKHIHWSTRPQDPITMEPMRRQIPVSTSTRDEPKSQEILDTLIAMSKHTVALISLSGELLELIEDRHKLFQLPKGKITNNLSKLIVPELHAPLLAGLHRLKKNEDSVMYQIEYNNCHLRFHLSICVSQKDRALLVVQEEPKAGTVMESPPSEVHAWDSNASEVIRGLEVELQHTKENLQAMIEELQTTNEEQQSTNEELVASNEELQSTNEELQSVNEELYTVNQEFNNKNCELTILAQDLENLIRAANIGTLYLDRTLTIRKFTPAVTEIIPILNSDIGRPLKDLVHGLNHDVFVDIQSVLETGEPVEREVRDTSGSWILMRCHPYLTKGALEDGVLVTFVNVTTLKNAQEFSAVVNQKLEEANRTLIEQSEELEDLFSILAHDLKRPVISLDGLLTLVEQSVDWPTGHTNRTHLLKALEECQRMQRLLVDLTQVSVKARQEPVYEDVDLQSFLDTIVERYQEQAQSLGVRLNVACDSAMLNVPKAVLEQAAHNLIENAFNYGSTNAKPRIDVACHIQGNQLHFTVTDNGKGIAAPDHAKVFELFRRLDPKASDGSGVGLVAVRRQILKVGGDVHLESIEGKGAKFSFTIPITRSADHISQDSIQILLIEDDALDKKILQRCLNEIANQQGIATNLAWARSLSDAKELLRTQPIDLIMLDLSLPDGHGLNFLNELRLLNDTPLPVIILSGHAEGIPFSNLKDQQVSYLPKVKLTAKSLHTTMKGMLVGSEKVSA
ncbi:MAG: chemotaxis protein CheB [Nitrospirales bacterium]